MNRFLSLIPALVACVVVSAQNLKVENVTATIDPMTVPMQRLDANDDICALVKVLYPRSGLVFEGNVVGDAPLRTNQYWVYLTAGTKFLQINAPEHYPLRIDFRDYGINGLEGKRIYELKLSSDMAVVPQEPAPSATATQQPATATKPSAPASGTGMTDPALMSQSADKLFATGKDLFSQYDKQFAYKALGKVADDKAMAQLLFDGYNCFLAALEKGSKKSKEICKILANHYNDYMTAAITIWNLKEYELCDKILSVYITMPFNPLIPNKPAAPDNKTYASSLYVKGLANWQMGNIKEAAELLERSIQYDNSDKAIFKYAYALNNEAGNVERCYELARKGNELFGKTDEDFAQYEASYYLENGRTADALKVLQQAENMFPNSATVQRSLGICLHAMSRFNDAKSHLTIAYRWNPADAYTNLALGEVIIQMAAEQDKLASNMSTKQYNENRRTNINPQLREAIPYLERAYSDEIYKEKASTLLRNVYFQLGDEANMRKYEK